MEKLLEIKGVGMSTVIGLIAEVGDIGRFTDPKQIQKLAGLEIVKKSSGKKKGQPRISKRGRQKLRRTMWELAITDDLESGILRCIPLLQELHQESPRRKAGKDSGCMQ